MTLEDHEKRLTGVEKCVTDLTATVNKMAGEASAILTLIRWVVTPLIVILGALVGVKIAL